jgi:hypothetical protein
VSIAPDGTISVQRWVLGADITIPRCGSTPVAEPPGVASTTTPAQPAPIRACAIVAVGAFNGASTVVSSEPLGFASTRPG